MCGRLWRQKQVLLSPQKTFVWHARFSRWYAKLFEGICKGFYLTQLKTDKCVYVKIVSNRKDHDGQRGNTLCTCTVHSACPIGILIVCSYVGDDSFFTNSTQLAKEFETHCNTRIKMTFEGPVNSYLSVKYDWCPETGAVSANQELHIDKILQRWGMSDCHSLPTVFAAKADAVVTERAEPISNPDLKIVKDFQELCGALLYVHVHTVSEIIYKAKKRHQLRGAHRHVKILIFPATSMAMLMQVLLMSNPKRL